MKVLDVFSGIGGFTLALDVLAGFETALFCDIDERSHAVLNHHMDRGMLPRVPIHGDIRTLHCSKHQFDMIVGGFPCTGFSSVGLREGTGNVGTGLFRELLRLVDECEPKFVMLENVGTILTFDEYPDIWRAFTQRGYRFTWTTMTASQLGAPHHRRRWWALAVRQDIQPGSVSLQLKDNTSLLHRWDANEPVARMVPEKVEGASHRYFLLGNTLVPCVARMAFLSLFTGLRDPYSVLVQKREFIYALPTDKQQCPGSSTSGTIDILGRMVAITPPEDDLGLVQRRTLVFDPNAYTPNTTRVPRTKLAPLETIHRDFFATPRTSMSLCHHLTRRSICDLGTQIRFERSTTHRDGYVNPQWVEWMMGYPLDWTLATSERTAPSCRV